MSVERHIHLDGDLSGSPENSPVNKYTALVPEVKMSVAHVALEWAVDGTMMVHRVTDGSDTVVSRSRRYRLQVTNTELAALEADEGDSVYFVPNTHVGDGADHTPYVESNCVFRIVEVQSREHATLDTYYVTIELQIS